MKSFEEIMSFEPQIAPIENGLEPNLVEMIEAYYENSGMFSSAEVRRLTSQYINQLKKFVGE